MIFEKINLENLLKVSRNVKVNIFLPVPSEIRESAWSELRQRVNGFVPKRALFFFFFFFWSIACKYLCKDELACVLPYFPPLFQLSTTDPHICTYHLSVCLICFLSFFFCARKSFQRVVIIKRKKLLKYLHRMIIPPPIFPTYFWICLTFGRAFQGKEQR